MGRTQSSASSKERGPPRDKASTSSDSDYEVISYDKEETKKKTKEMKKVESYHQARMAEEVVKAEPLYTMVIKSPTVVRAKEEDANNAVTTNGDHKADSEEQKESPVMWEYKLPAPPTPFQDSGNSSVMLDKTQDDPVAESSRHSSMSTDSLQESSFDEEKSPRPGADSGLGAPSAASPIIVEEATKVTLHHGAHLMEESVTEEPQTTAAVITARRDSDSVLVLPKDPLVNQYGMESTTDEPLSPPSSIPPLPSTSPPSYSDSEDDEAELNSAGLRFSISTYTRREVDRDQPTYDKKLSRPDSPDLAPLTTGPYMRKTHCGWEPIFRLSTQLTKCILSVVVYTFSEPEQAANFHQQAEAPAAAAAADAPSAPGTKEAEVAVDRAKAQESGSHAQAEPTPTPRQPPASAVLPTDLIQQFQSVLAMHTLAGMME